MSYEAVLERVQRELPATHPYASKYPHIAGPLAREIAYREWRRHRVYDDMTIIPGAKMPDGEMGYALNFFEDKNVTGVYAGARRVIHLSREEMRELRDKIDEELKP